MITIEAAKFIPYPGAVLCSRFRTLTRRAPHRAAVGHFGLETAFPRSTAKEGEIPPSRVAAWGVGTVRGGEEPTTDRRRGRSQRNRVWCGGVAAILPKIFRLRLVQISRYESKCKSKMKIPLYNKRNTCIQITSFSRYENKCKCTPGGKMKYLI
jgi:hypothetical protein